ncbi:unnamed protein product [Phytophthora lilii]|uniref:Unnamed protein product n=1 Tax=Phytophthora lilii TaxID=2077276 RepID=A0A9W6TI91_9STRA|nr:unnamed protein product [Phytophthora lilii]
MMNLFLALLLDKFSSEDEDQIQERKMETKTLARKLSSMKIAPIPNAVPKYDQFASDKEQPKTMNVGEEHLQAFNATKRGGDQKACHSEPLQGPSVLAAVAASSGITKSIAVVESEQQVVKRGPARILAQLSAHLADKVHLDSKLQSESKSYDRKWFGKLNAGMLVCSLRDNSLCLFPRHSCVRRWALNLIVHPYFDSVILALVTASSITLAIDNPLLNPASTLAITLKRLDTVFTIIFTVEMMLKIVALGLIQHKEAYLRNGWNVLDCVIVITSLVMLAETSDSHHSLKSLRSLLTYLKGTLNSCSGDVFNALSDLQVNVLENPRVWSTLSLEQQRWFANTSCFGFPTESVTSKYVCECWGADWGPVVPQNFNNVGNAMITFFEMSTTENWSLLMIACIDATEIDMQPIRDYNMWWAVFFSVFMMFGSFFVVNLFVGVIIDNFNRMTEALGDSFMLTPEQKKWMKAQKAAAQVGPQLVLKPFHDRVRRTIFFFVRSKRFEWFIFVCIVINTLLMASQYYGQSTVQTTVVSVGNDIFALIFTVEAGLKITAFGYAYFEDNWNRFDFFVVVGTLITIMLEALTTARLRIFAMLVRAFRVTRIFRLVKASKGIRHILTTLYLALPGLSNVASILFLLLFTYTTMGVQMFAKVGLSDNIDVHANFQTFGKGFLFMIRAATGESWDDCMHDFASSPEGCVDDPLYDPKMCGFSDSDDCTPLNGCGNPVWGCLSVFLLLHAPGYVCHAECDGGCDPRQLRSFKRR